ncbi:hypothetical protein RN001_003788 [Aquatica leii]|uniref:Uncharacterized protein n=1 Tax=Aquatica leii TaxID=1421715 RepID=A0AAN7PIU6_9COLE|nr:hypothetical protein RN001_003788 [Aquatica leii]
MQGDEDTNTDNTEAEDCDSTIKQKDTKDIRQKNKLLREKGLAYKGLKKSSENGHYLFTEDKSSRKLLPRCSSSHCKKVKNRFCSEFSELERKQCFKQFWKMSWDMRKVYVAATVQMTQTMRPAKENSKRNYSFQYYLKKKGKELQVCKTMFLNTLNLKEWSVRNWVVTSNSGMHGDNSLLHMKDFLEKLPKLESHYCRSDTKKLYLETIFQRKMDVYRAYKQVCNENNKTILSAGRFQREMVNMNIGIHLPKKDQCDTCIGHKTGNITVEAFEDHIRKKNEARAEKTKHKDLAIQNPEEIAVFTMDMQAVKLAPMIRATAIYFKTKLAVHNYTVFNLVTKNVHCYLWHEVEGGLEASVFCTIMIKHLTNYLEQHLNTKTIILYSDGCGYQNRNNTFGNALYYLSKLKNICIIQKILERGHTQMEVDSAHSLIERRLKNKDIYLPSDYINVCKQARLAQPFSVEYLSHDYFLDYTNLSYYDSIRPGVRRHDPTINDLRCIKYEESGISFKANYSDDWKTLQRKPKHIDMNEVIIDALYKDRLKITLEKYHHLQVLKGVLPMDVHSFYDALPHLTTSFKKMKTKNK